MRKVLDISLFIGFLCASAGCLSASAQNVSLPYQMNFESNESAELANWTLNPGANASVCTDKWIVGSAEHSAGQQALYISNNGLDAQFDSIPDIQYAYRDILLPRGRFDLSFDWLCVGGASSALYVGFADFTTAEKNLMVAQTSGAFNSTLKNAMLQFSGYPSGLKGSDTWQNVSTTITSDGATVQRLVFVWVNGNKSKANNSIGACVDNIVITNTNCKRPTSISARVISCDSVVVAWTGTSASYELEYRAAGSDNWSTKRNIIASGIQGSISITNLTEGSYDFRVRGICTPDTSAWAYYSNFVVYCPELHCVNFIDLHASTVTCTYGNTNNGPGSASYTDEDSRNQAYAHVGVVDYGSESILSRHTVNWDKTETDPRTGNNLPLIPKGGYASVRLGNWEDGYGAESITYEYVVDSSNAVLLMQYAVVLQDPDGHGDDSPRFLLEILDENNNLIEPTCGKRNFVATYVDRDEWRTFTPASSASVLYKPWTTVGLNLSELGVQDGQVIRVRLTTFDCFWSAHYGYAYFTLDCAKATIETASCAKDASVTMSLVAPEGFKYQWYDKNNKAIPGANTRIFEPGDTATYRCRLTSTENAACYFDLYSQCFPRLPKPDFKAEFAAKDCKNTLRMDNTTYIRVYQRDGYIDLHNEKCDSYLWETWGTYSDGKPFATIESDHESPIFEYPEEGGDFFVKLTATIAGSCSEDTVMSLHIDPIRSYDLSRDTILCRPANQPDYVIYLDGQQIATSGVYPIVYKTKAGCDSIITWNVTINESHRITLPDTTICYGESICYGDSCIGPNSPKSIYRSGMWIWDHMRSTTGCDSTIMRKVTLMDEIKPIISFEDEVLSLPFGRVELVNGEIAADLKVLGTGFDGYVLSYVDATGQRKEDVHTPEDSILAALPLNEYIFIFSNTFGCEQRDTVLIGGDTLCVNLLSQIQCECGKPVLNIPYRKCVPANRARLSTCSVKFSDADKVAQGFEDARFTGLKEEDTIRIAVPAGAEPGIYSIDLIFDTIVGGCLWGQNAFHASIQLTYDSSVIFHRWTENAIISLAGANVAKKADGTDYALYTFDNFQWLRNGAEVEGETRSYMEQPGVLNMADAFSLRMTRADGVVFTTCSYIPGHASASHVAGRAPSASVTPADPLAGAPVELSVSEDAEMEIYSIMGNKVLNGRFDQGVNTFTAPTIQGIYIMNVRMREEVITLRLRVR